MLGKKRLTQAVICSLVLSGTLAACEKQAETTVDPGETTQEVQTEETNQPIESVESEETVEPTQSEPVSEEESGASFDRSKAADFLITDQSFDVTLDPLGEVRFESYCPDTSDNLMADAIFVIVQDDEVKQILPGMFEDNIRANESFDAVEAVSFPDYNSDGFDDILIICDYEFASGPDVSTGNTEVRIYSGSEDGTFILEEDLSQEANEALAVKTIESVKSFLGVGRTDNSKEDSSWKQAYIDYLNGKEAAEDVQGYSFIYLDGDDIPELVEVGDCEATGCRILAYYNGEVKVSQLNRLYFSYIEKENLLCNSEGNMDTYYDLVLQLVDGELSLIAAGYYGAKDNSNVQFDETGEPIYEYEWNDVSMDKEEYAKELNAVYDTAKAKDGYVWEDIYTQSQMLKLLQEW